MLFQDLWSSKRPPASVGVRNDYGYFLAKRTAEEEKNRAQLKPSNGKLSRPISSVKRPFAVRSPGLRYRTNGTSNTKFQENFEKF